MASLWFPVTHLAQCRYHRAMLSQLSGLGGRSAPATPPPSYGVLASPLLLIVPKQRRPGVAWGEVTARNTSCSAPPLAPRWSPSGAPLPSAVRLLVLDVAQSLVGSGKRGERLDCWSRCSLRRCRPAAAPLPARRPLRCPLVARSVAPPPRRRELRPQSCCLGFKGRV